MYVRVSSMVIYPVVNSKTSSLLLETKPKEETGATKERSATTKMEKKAHGEFKKKYPWPQSYKDGNNSTRETVLWEQHPRLVAPDSEYERFNYVKHNCWVDCNMWAGTTEDRPVSYERSEVPRDANGKQVMEPDDFGPFEDIV